MINNLGVVSVNLAYTYGPAGPVSSITSTSVIALTIIIAIVHQ